MTGFSIIFVFAVCLAFQNSLWSSHTQLPLKINCIFPAYIEKRDDPVDNALALEREGKKSMDHFTQRIQWRINEAHTEALKGGKITTVKR